jgi:glutamate--cysteine ligase
VPTSRRTLTRQAARRLIAERCFTPSLATSLGLELEFLTFPTGDRNARPDLAAMQAATAASLPHQSRVTFEPGGQVEVSSLPQPSPVAAIAATTTDVAALTAALGQIGVEMLAVGADRWRPPARLLDLPRYRAMEAHFDRGGRAGRRMMCNTAALQVNIELGIDDRRWRAAHAIAPALVASFANSPGRGWKSTRLRTWLELDRRRTAPISTGADAAIAWADYALAAPAFLCDDGDGGCLPLSGGASLAGWIDDGHPDRGFPTVDDVQLHLTTLFPPVRPRGWLEIRYLDALPSPWWEVATLVITALLNDAVVDDALNAVGETEGLWTEAARDGLDDERLAAAADRCFALATAATGDAGVLDYAERFVARRVPAWT